MRYSTAIALLTLAGTPAAAQTFVYAGAADGLYRSIDSGASWERALTNVEANDLAYSRLNKLTIYAATDSGLYRTVDGGQSWTLRSAEVARRIAVDAHSPDRVLAISRLFRLLRSADGGRTWEALDVGGPSEVVADQVQSGLFYVTGKDGLLVTEDAGDSWRLSESAPKGTRSKIVATHPARPRFAYGLTPYEPVTATNDAGLHWSGTMASLDSALEASFSEPYPWIIHPWYPPSADDFQAIVADPVRPNDFHVCATETHDRFRPPVEETVTNYVLASLREGVWRIWNSPGNIPCRAIARTADGEGWLFVGTELGLFRRKDGVLWQPVEEFKWRAVRTLLAVDMSVKPRIDSITNAASFSPAGVVAGSLATINGVNLAGRKTEVEFDGIPAWLIYVADTQINLVLPAELAGKSSVSVTLRVDGVASETAILNLAQMAPAIFSGGVLNQDNTVNSDAAAALAGTVVRVFATGIAELPDWQVTITIGQRANLFPVYVGPAPDAPGVQRLDVVIPPDLPTGDFRLSVCARDLDDLRNVKCSDGVAVTIRH